MLGFFKWSKPKNLYQLKYIPSSPQPTAHAYFCSVNRNPRPDHVLLLLKWTSIRDILGRIYLYTDIVWKGGHSFFASHFSTSLISLDTYHASICLGSFPSITSQSGFHLPLPFRLIPINWYYPYFTPHIPKVVLWLYVKEKEAVTRSRRNLYCPLSGIHLRG